MWRRRSLKTSSKGLATLNMQTDTLLKSINDILTGILSKCKILCDNAQKYEEIKEELDKYRTQDKKNKHVIDQNSARIAQLYQDIEEKDMKISDMITQIQDFQKPKEREDITCECCCMQTPKDDCLMCSNNHVICKLCIDQTCKDFHDNVQISDRRLSCCSMHDCSGYIPEHQFSQTAHGKLLLQDFFIRDITPMLLKYIKNFSNEEIETNIAFLKSDGKFRAFQCPNCGFGPIIHAHCSDLISHHGQHTEKNVIVNNSCPNCKFLADDVHDLDDWDGK